MAEACLTALQALPPSLQQNIGALLGMGDAMQNAAGTGSRSQPEGKAIRAEVDTQHASPDCGIGGAVSAPLRLDGGVLLVDGFLKSSAVQVPA